MCLMLLLEMEMNILYEFMKIVKNKYKKRKVLL